MEKQCLNECPTNQVQKTGSKNCICDTGLLIDLELKECLTECPEGQVVNVEGKKCLAECPEGQVLNLEGKKCLAECPAGQVVKTSSNICICDTSLVLNLEGNQCWPECPKDQVVDSEGKKCIEKCEKNGQVKIAGEKGYQCKDQCPESYYADTNSICQNCHKNCKTCTGPEEAECLSCEEGKSLTEITTVGSKEIGKCLLVDADSNESPNGNDGENSNESPTGDDGENTEVPTTAKENLTSNCDCQCSAFSIHGPAAVTGRYLILSGLALVLLFF